MKITMSENSDIMKGISRRAMRNRLSSRTDSSLVSCDCPLIHSFEDSPTFQHQCTAGLNLISERWNKEDWCCHFKKDHSRIIDELEVLCDVIRSEGRGSCPFGCSSMVDDEAEDVPPTHGPHSDDKKTGSLVETVMATIKQDREFQSSQKKRDPLTGGLRIEHDERHQIEKAKASMFLHLASQHLPELQFIRSIAQELCDPLRSLSQSCPFSQSKQGETEFDLEQEDKAPSKCVAKHLQVTSLIKDHHQQLVVAARHLRLQVESSLSKKGFIACCSVDTCTEKLTSLEWGMQHYARLHSTEIASRNFKMIERQLKEADLKAIACPFTSSNGPDHCQVSVKKSHRFFPHLDTVHGKELKDLAVSLAHIGGHREKKVLVDLLKILDPHDKEGMSTEPENEHICILCSVLKEQRMNGLPVLASSLERMYHDSVPELLQHIVEDHKDLLLALTAFASNVMGDPSRPFISCPLHPCTAGGGGEGFRAVFGGPGEVHGHIASRHIDHLVSILRVALLVVQTSLLNPSLLKCPFSCHSATSSFGGGMELLLHLMQTHGEELLKHSNHSSHGSRPKKARESTQASNPVKEEFGLLEGLDGDVDVSFSFTGSLDKDQRKPTSKDQTTAVTAALIAAKLSQQKAEAAGGNDFGLKSEVDTLDD
jgi:hypothetical protein